ncbi:MAG TPA: sugar ABC transporter permease, partial [Candidatus Caccousia avistercoris]|nr:sugar ABC transporter permease [Candidatus Caccousia avistercoris]
LFAGLGVFHFYAFFNNIGISLTDKKSLKDGTFIGLQNYMEILADESFFQSFGNTLPQRESSSESSPHRAAVCSPGFY